MAALAHEAEQALLRDRPVPELEPERGERVGDWRRRADEAELGKAEQLAGGERAVLVVLPEAAVGDQLGDVPGRVVEVARVRRPEVEIEDDLVAVSLREERNTLAQPVQGGAKPVARSEEREVVEGLRLARPEVEAGRSDLDRDQVGPFLTSEQPSTSA